jgi:hypothetical protein
VAGVPHGFDDDAETRRLLRSRPPRRALDWAGSVLGGTVAATRALRGGTASAVHLLTVASPAGGTYRAVLRRYVRPELNFEEPGMAEHEARALMFVAHLDVPTPNCSPRIPAETRPACPPCSGPGCPVPFAGGRRTPNDG